MHTKVIAGNNLQSAYINFDLYGLKLSENSLPSCAIMLEKQRETSIPCIVLPKNRRTLALLTKFFCDKDIPCHCIIPDWFCFFFFYKCTDVFLMCLCIRLH